MNKELLASSKNQNDEIDIRESLLMIWQGKWLIAIITIIFFSLGIVYVRFFQSHTAIFNIEPISSYEIDHYAELNYLLERTETAITPQGLVDLLMERVRNRQDFLQAVKDLNFIPQGNQSEEEWMLAINEFVYSIQLLRPLSSEELAKSKLQNPPLSWRIKADGLRDQEQYQQLLELAFKKSNEFVREILMNKIEQKISLLQANRIRNVEDIDIEIKSVREDYQARVANRIAYLTEQAQIARQLGIAKNTIESQSFNTENGMITTLQTEIPFYMSGYESIEKELNLLKNRTTIDEFVPELIELNKKRRAFLDERYPQRLMQALNESNITMKEKFISAKLDMNEIIFETKPKSILLLVLAIFIGIIVGIILVLAKTIVRGKNTNES